MSGHEHDASLAADIFGSSALKPVDGYSDATQSIEQAVPYPEYAPQPLGGGEPKFFATVAGHADKPIFEYPDGRKVVRVPRIAAVSAPVNEQPRAVAETHHPATAGPRDVFSFKMERNVDGGLSGSFAAKGDYRDFLGGLAGVRTASSSPAAPARQLGSAIFPTQPTPQRVVAPTLPRPNEAPASENDNHWSSGEAATVATHGLKKVIKTVLRPRKARAILALSVAIAGGAYHLEGGELPIHGNPISIFQADYNQVTHNLLATIAAEVGRL